MAVSPAQSNTLGVNGFHGNSHTLHTHTCTRRLAPHLCSRELTSQWKMERSPPVKQEALCSMSDVSSVDLLSSNGLGGVGGWGGLHTPLRSSLRRRSRPKVLPQFPERLLAAPERSAFAAASADCVIWRALCAGCKPRRPVPSGSGSHRAESHGETGTLQPLQAGLAVQGEQAVWLVPPTHTHTHTPPPSPVSVVVWRAGGFASVHVHIQPEGGNSR